MFVARSSVSQLLEDQSASDPKLGLPNMLIPVSEISERNETQPVLELV